MIPSKNLKNGFTFIELVLAVAIIGICITALFTLQSNLLVQVAKRTDAIRRVFFLKNIVYEFAPTLEKVGKPEIKKIEDPAMQVTLLVKPVPEKSKLHQLSHMYIVSATANWERDGIKYDETLTSFVLIPPPPKEEKKP